MTSANFLRALRSFANRRPFEPFMVELVTGTSWRIIHPEAMIMRGDLIVFVAPRDKYQLFDSSSVTQLFDVEDDDMELE